MQLIGGSSNFGKISKHQSYYTCLALWKHHVNLVYLWCFHKAKQVYCIDRANVQGTYQSLIVLTIAWLYIHIIEQKFIQINETKLSVNRLRVNQLWFWRHFGRCWIISKGENLSQFRVEVIHKLKFKPGTVAENHQQLWVLWQETNLRLCNVGAILWSPSYVRL